MSIYADEVHYEESDLERHALKRRRKSPEGNNVANLALNGP